MRCLNMRQRVPPTRHKHKHWTWEKTLVVMLFYALLIGVMTTPAPFVLSTKLIGNNIDNWIFYWNNWWLTKALGEGLNPFFTPYAFFPQGASLIAHSNSFLNSALALPLTPIVGPIAAYNLVWLFGLWIGALGMFWLARALTKNTAAAVWAGFLFTFAPYHLTQALAHAHLGSIHWWPWYAWSLHRALHETIPSRRYIATSVAGVFAALTLWTGLQLAVMLALWTVVYSIGYLLCSVIRGQRTSQASRVNLWTVGKSIGLLGLVALLLSLPLLVPVTRNWNAGWTEAFDEGLSKQTDLVAYLLPPTYHPFFGAHVNAAYERFIANRAFMPYLGYTALLLASLAVLNRIHASQSRKRAPTHIIVWGTSLMLWLLFAAGPALRVNGTLYRQIKLPYRWLGDRFPLSTLRSPDRMNLLVVFSLPVLAGYGIARLTRRWRWVSIPVGLLLLVEYLCSPLPMWELPASSPFFTEMAQAPATYGVVDYPMGYNEAKLWLYAQTLHEKPLVEGHISRYTPELYTLIISNPILRAMYQPQVDHRPPRLPSEPFLSQTVPLPALGPALRELQSTGVRYILAHKSTTDATLDEHLQRVLPIVPVYEDATLSVIDLSTPLAVVHDGFPINLSPDLSLIRFDVQYDTEGHMWDFQVVIQGSKPAQPLSCTLALIGTDGPVIQQPMTFFADGNDWRPGDIDVRETQLSLSSPLTPGHYHWELTCSNKATYLPPEELTMTPNQTAIYRRRELDVHFAETISLLGYRWRTEGNRLWVALWWDVLQAPGKDYKVFIHLLDADGALVAQYDAMPCAWACPTRDWEAGKIIADEVSLDLWGLRPGHYQLAVGLYDANTLERLPASDSSGAMYKDGYFLLPDALTVGGTSE